MCQRSFVKKKKSNRETVAEAFEKRTGVKYENWIQAMAIQRKLESTDSLLQKKIRVGPPKVDFKRK